MSKAITIYDVATRAGVSASTVSRILSGSPTQFPFSEQTRERVLQAARELGYIPHPVARALRGKSTSLLGLIVRAVDDPLYSQLIEVISCVAKENGYDLLLGYAESDPDTALALSSVLDPRRCDGLILIGDLGHSEEDRAILVEMEHLHPRMAVLLRGDWVVDKCLTVGVDNKKGVHIALDYLARLGHRRIAFLFGSRPGDLRERRDHYIEYMKEHFGEVRSEYIQSETNSYPGGYRAMQMLLSLPTPPTAVFASDDTMAIGALRAALEMAYRVPDDVSIIGFDDIRVAAYLYPSLTTVRQPIERIASTAVEMIIEKVVSDSVFDEAQHILLEPELAVRESCGPPKE